MSSISRVKPGQWCLMGEVVSHPKHHFIHCLSYLRNLNCSTQLLEQPQFKNIQLLIRHPGLLSTHWRLINGYPKIPLIFFKIWGASVPENVDSTQWRFMYMSVSPEICSKVSGLFTVWPVGLYIIDLIECRKMYSVKILDSYQPKHLSTILVGCYCFRLSATTRLHLQFSTWSNS